MQFEDSTTRKKKLPQPRGSVLIMSTFFLLCSCTVGADQFDLSSVVISSPERCFRLELLEKGPAQLDYKAVPASLAWTSSGVWLDERTMLLADVAFSKIAKVSLDEGLVSSVNEFGGNKLGSPRYISPLPEEGGYLLLDAKVAGDRREKRVYHVDRYGEISSPPISVSRGRRLGEFTLNGIHRFSAMGDGVLAYVGLQPAEGDAWNAFVYLDQNNHEIFGRIEEEYVHLMTRDSTAMTAIGETGFFLMFNEEPRIVRADLGKGTTDLDHFPEESIAGGFRTPRLERPSRARFVDDMIDAEVKVQNSRTAKSLFSWNDRLFVLAKSSMSSYGRTTWWAIEVSQDDGSEIDRFELPTTAEDIVLISGSRFAAVEKGPVRRAGEPPGYAIYRRSSSVVVFSSDWLNAAGGAGLRKQSANCETVRSDG